jgi:hypothetical protein
VAVVERGHCTFAQKYARVQQAGAIAMLCVNTNEVWPYTMQVLYIFSSLLLFSTTG